MAKVLVTGASGFIGFHLVRQAGGSRRGSDGAGPAAALVVGARSTGGPLSRRRRARRGGDGRRRGGAVNRLSPGRLRRRPAHGGIPSRQRGGDGGGVRSVRTAGNAAGAGGALLDGRHRPDAERPPQRGRRPARAGLALRPEQAGRRTGGGSVGQSRRSRSFVRRSSLARAIRIACRSTAR